MCNLDRPLGNHFCCFLVFFVSGGAQITILLRFRGPQQFTCFLLFFVQKQEKIIRFYMFFLGYGKVSRRFW